MATAVVLPGGVAVTAVAITAVVITAVAAVVVV